MLMKMHPKLVGRNCIFSKVIFLSIAPTMKDLLRQYAAYHVWAQQRIDDVLLALPEAQHHQELPSSFTSLYKTVLHMLDAESIWWQRLKLHERILVPSEHFTGDFPALLQTLLQQSKQWEEWVSTASDLSLEHVFQYQDRKRDVHKMPVYQMIHHVFNHSTYHRGQLVTMLRQLQVDKIPSTDFSFWVLRGKK